MICYGILKYFERGRSTEARNDAEAGEYPNVSRYFQTLKQAIFYYPHGSHKADLWCRSMQQGEWECMLAILRERRITQSSGL
jgi:hypothetical protein